MIFGRKKWFRTEKWFCRAKIFYVKIKNDHNFNMVLSIFNIKKLSCVVFYEDTQEHAPRAIWLCFWLKNVIIMFFYNVIFQRQNSWKKFGFPLFEPLSAAAQPRLSYHMIYHMISYDMISYHMISYHMILYQMISYHISWYQIMQYHAIMCYLMSKNNIIWLIITYLVLRCYKISRNLTTCLTNDRTCSPVMESSEIWSWYVLIK